MADENIPECTNCKSSSAIIPIKYGLPDAESFDLVQKKELIFGGFDQDDESPLFYCKECSLKLR